VKTTALAVTDRSTTTTVTTSPSRPSPRAPVAAERTVVARTATPAVAMSRRLRSRLSSGFGRLLRGTAQATFIAFCTACAMPSAPYTEPATAITSATPLPRSPWGSASSSPMTGNWLSAEPRMSRRSRSLPWRRTPSADDASSRSGNTDRKP
jgi:hypothetical protein